MHCILQQDLNKFLMLIILNLVLDVNKGNNVTHDNYINNFNKSRLRNI